MYSLNLTLIKNRIAKIQTQNQKNHIFKAQTKKSRRENNKTKKMKSIYKK